MKVRYHESFLFPQGQEDFGRSLVFPQGQLHGLGAYPANLKVIGSVRGLHDSGMDTIDYKIVTRESAIAALQPNFKDWETGQLIDISGSSNDQLEYMLFKSFEHMNPRTGRNYLIKDSTSEREFSGKQSAAQQAAAQQAAAQQAAAAAAQQAAAQPYRGV